MIIQQVDIYPSPIRLKEPFITSLGPETEAGNVLVVIHTREGITGFGECNPFMPISGESMETAVVVAKYLARALIGANALRIADHHTLFDRIIYGNASIKSAFDIALYDIAAQHAGVPLYKYLGGSNDRILVTDYTVSLGPVDKMTSDAVRIIDNGFTIIKVKLGSKGDKDVERIRSIRAAVGDGPEIRVDANQGWSVNDAPGILEALAPSRIQFCEEPVPRYEFMELPQLSKKSPVPIMADESCCDQHDAHRLIAIQACGLFNVKLGKSDGLHKAIKIAALAEQAGIFLQVGGFLESRLGFTASAHFALASRNVLHCDFDTPLMFEEDPVTGGITYSRGGRITLPEAPGLGAAIDPGYLKRLNAIHIR